MATDKLNELPIKNKNRPVVYEYSNKKQLDSREDKWKLWRSTDTRTSNIKNAIFHLI